MAEDVAVLHVGGLSPGGF